MKIVLTIARVFVGLLFIFSGLVKANDPLGLAYKMQEFFEIWNASLAHSSFFMSNMLIHLFEFLHDQSLALSVIMIAFEIIAGVALLLGWQMKLFSWLLLLLIIFFTFLTGYAYYSDKFKNCGCFGDCIPITPLTSFLKDILLLILIVLIFFNRRRVRRVFSNTGTSLVMGLAILLSFGLQWYALNYLPPVDCLPFKKGNNIKQQMQMPAGARPDSFAIVFVYEKSGKQFEFSPSELPADLDTYNFVDRKDKLIRKGNAEPPIKGFALSGETNVDSTDIVLSHPYTLLLFCENFTTPLKKWQDDFSKLYAEAKQKNIPVYLITTSVDKARLVLPATSFADVPIFKCDYTAIRSAARSNPCLYLLKQGNVINKWSYKNINNAAGEINAIPAQPAMHADAANAPDTMNHQPDSTNSQH